MPYATDLPVARFEVPSRAADLGFALDLPADWIQHPLPDDDLDFSDPLRMLGLCAITAPHAAIVWAVAARPGYQEGSVHDWAMWLIGQAGLAPRTQGEGRLGGLPALVGEAVLQGDLGPMLVRWAFAEDGDRLINATLTAPMLLAGAMESVWQQALESFELETPRGPTVALWPPLVACAPAGPAEADTDFDTDTAPQTAADPDDSDDTLAPLGASRAEPVRADGPAWLEAARALERAGRLEDAEQAILTALDNAGACLAVAELYQDRAARLALQGDAVGAQAASVASVRWIDFYASSATSGGEGAARSREVAMMRCAA